MFPTFCFYVVAYCEQFVFFAHLHYIMIGVTSPAQVWIQEDAHGEISDWDERAQTWQVWVEIYNRKTRYKISLFIKSC